MNPFILEEKRDDLVILTLNRPEKRNALSPEMVTTFRKHLADIRQDPRLRAVIVTGAGKAFCAGADLAYLEKISHFTDEQNLRDSQNIAGLLQDLFTLPKITMAMLNGAALAGGMGLALCCDYVFADQENASLGLTEVRIGFVPAIVMNFLIRRTNLSHANALAMGGEIINPLEAHRMGLIHQLAGADELRGTCLAFIAQLLSRNSFSAMMQTKTLLQELLDLPLEKGLQRASEINARSRKTTDCQKGLRAFLTKKPINWRE